MSESGISPLFLGDIITGPDLNIWFTDPNAETIGELRLSTQSITEVPMPAGVHGPFGLTIESDGNLWFSEDGIGVSHVGRLTLNTSAVPPA